MKVQRKPDIMMDVALSPNVCKQGFIARKGKPTRFK